MALEFSSSSALRERMGSDHQSHLRAMSRVLAGAIATELNERTARLDGRGRARAKPGAIRAYKTAEGATGYSITVIQQVLPDVPEKKRKLILQQQAAVKSKLASKNGVIGLLGSGGVH